MPISETGCHIWLRAHTTFGYGVLTVAGRPTQRAHRMAYEIENGPIPKGRHVLHRCDVPACINPAHLYLGDQKDNVRDMLERKRARVGEACSGSKLTAEDVLSIRTEYAQGNTSLRALGARYGVNYETIRECLPGHKNWKQLGGVSSLQA